MAGARSTPRGRSAPEPSSRPPRRSCGAFACSSQGRTARPKRTTANNADISELSGGVEMAAQDLESTARALVADNKGILAADESDGTIKKRFDSIGVESTEENRRAYRDLLFTTEGGEEFISGVILFDETIRQSSSDR